MDQRELMRKISKAHESQNKGNLGSGRHGHINIEGNITEQRSQAVEREEAINKM